METKKKVRILCLDGGGIRGIIPATVIQYAEEYLQKKVPGTTIADHFDFIAGTSTGGILTGIYLTPQVGDKTKARFTATEALNFYKDEGHSIFNASKIKAWKRIWGLGNATSYSPSYLEKLLKAKFGDLKISELMKPCLITTYDIITKSSFFFTSREKTEEREFFVRDVLRSTSAAPTYFPPATVKNIAPKPGKGDPKSMINLDGGVFANNPTMCAYAEVRNLNFESRNNLKPSAKDMYILSIGTGGGGYKLEKEEESHSWSLLTWAKSIPDIMMDGSIDTVAYQMAEIRDTLQESDEGDYMRVDTPVSARKYASDMSDASPKNIKDLMKAGEKTLEEARKNGLDAFLDGLLD